MGNERSGFTLIEVLITTAVLTIFLLATAAIVQVAMQSLGEARLRSEATRIAQERLELARNLPYGEVGTEGGIPSGPLIQSETVSLHGAVFNVNTTVLYVDDPFDGLAPADLIPADYKRVKIAVSWSGLFASKTPIILMTDVSATGKEMEENAGTLSLRVFNALGQPLSSAVVSIQSTGLDPVIDMEVLSDSDGMVVVPGAPICNSCYRISVTKDGYTQDRTYAFSEVDNPTKPDLSVLKGQISEVSFAIDVPSILTVKATRNKAASYQPFSGVQFLLRGTKTIGTTSAGEPVYTVNQTVITSTGGLASVPNLAWDQYYLSLPTGSSVDMAGSWPFLPISLLPSSNQQVTVVVQAASQHALLVQALDETMQPVAAYQATLVGPDSIATQSSGMANQGDWSQAYFPSLTNSMYTLTLESPGFATASAAIDVINDTQELFILETEAAL
jgi:prepilin-type N-terminal cleavage/methylation domain-containing protein